MARNVRVITGPRATGEIERAQELADALTARALRPRGPEQRGPVQVQMSPWEGVFQLGEAAIASHARNKASDLAAADMERQKAANDAMIHQLTGPRRLTEQGQPTGAVIDAPLDLETGRPMLVSDKAQTLAAAMGGMDPYQSGNALGGAMLQQAMSTPKYERVDLGDSIGVVDERGQVIHRIPKGATPDTRVREEGANARHAAPSGSAQLGAQTTMRGQNIGAATAARGQNLTYEAALRNAEATAGRYRAEQDEKAEKEQTRREGQAMKAESVIAEVDKALALVSPRTTGFVGGATRAVAPFEAAGTDALTLARTVETVQANLGFDELQKMRENSPTGGALGQVAVQELMALRATIANLDPNLPAPVLKQNLEKVKNHYGRWLMTTQGKMPPPDGAPVEGAFGLPAAEDTVESYYD